MKRKCAECNGTGYVYPTPKFDSPELANLLRVIASEYGVQVRQMLSKGSSRLIAKARQDVGSPGTELEFAL